MLLPPRCGKKNELAKLLFSLFTFAVGVATANDLPPPDQAATVPVLRVPSYCEGVVFDHAGNGYISWGKSITRFSLDGNHSVWAETGAPNGHKILADGTHLVCDASRHAVLRLSADGKLLEPPASRECDGKPLRGPNDLTLDTAHSGFYFTDPGGSDLAHPIGTVHYVDKSGVTHRVDGELAFPNGIALAADGKRLFLAESQKNRILVYDVVAPGKLGPRQLFAELPRHPDGDPLKNQPDGICLDAVGNLYVAHYGMKQVQVLDPQGKNIRRYDGGNVTTSNVAFGGPRHDQLFITGGLGQESGEGGLFRIDLGAKGLVILPDKVALDTPRWRAGVATAKITPDRRLPMAGYASRKEPAEGTEQELYAKALAIQDARGERVVFVTLDLIGVLETLRESVARQVQEQVGLPPASLLMNASHTHCGPAYGSEEAKDYFSFLESQLVSLVGQALARLEPAQLAYSVSQCSVAMNRRTPTADGFINHPNPFGPVDHSVPVLSVRSPGGELRAVLFGYACHNTTMGFLRWLGDYAGYAQEYFEQDHPGVTALFLMGCGGDQNPYPRSDLKYAQQHGRSLATAVEAALEVNQRTPRHQRPLQGPLQVGWDRVPLEFTALDREPFSYPVQVIRLGDDLLLIALGSEVVVDYALRLKRELAADGTPTVWVAGYSNVYAGYIPSRRVLEEGGYEARSRPWKPELEEKIIGQVHATIRRLRNEAASDG